MTKYYCIYTNSTCEDGYLPFKDHPCLMWDEREGACLIRENAKYLNEQFNKQSKMLNKFPVHPLLKDVNLASGEKNG